MEKLFRDFDLEFHHLVKCSPYVYISRLHPLAGKDVITLEELEPYPCLAFEQGENGSLFMAEELLSDHEYERIIKACDRATMLNLMTGLNAYTLCSGIICEELNGDGYRAVPLDSDKIMHIGYVKRQGCVLSPLAKIYLEELNRCNVNVLDHPAGPAR